MATTKKGASGNGNLRKRSDGRWEARYTTGYDPKTGKQIQKSVYGKTQKEVRQKLNQIVTELDSGTYIEPCKMTVGQWLDIWLEDYQVRVKESTAFLYERQLALYIRPKFNRTPLDQLETHAIQKLYNSLGKPREDKPALSAKSIKNIHGIFHRALTQAVELGYLRFNPSNPCIIPKIVKKDIQPLTDEELSRLLQEIKEHQYELPITFCLFAGLREGEVLGLQWDCVNFDRGTILVDKQLCRHRKAGGGYYFSTPKNGKSRTIAPAPFVMNLLRTQKELQERQRQEAGMAWENSGLVFTTALGRYISYRALYDCYKRIVAKLGLPKARVHDLRHTYAVNSIRAGDDIKSVQSNLGHSTAAFTLDVYGHFTEDMQRASAQRMETFITDTLGL